MYNCVQSTKICIIGQAFDVRGTMVFSVWSGDHCSAQILHRQQVAISFDDAWCSAGLLDQHHWYVQEVQEVKRWHHWLHGDLGRNLRVYQCQDSFIMDGICFWRDVSIRRPWSLRWRFRSGRLRKDVCFLQLLDSIFESISDTSPPASLVPS